MLQNAYHFSCNASDVLQKNTYLKVNIFVECAYVCVWTCNVVLKWHQTNLLKCKQKLINTSEWNMPGSGLKIFSFTFGNERRENPINESQISQNEINKQCLFTVISFPHYACTHHCTTGLATEPCLGRYSQLYFHRWFGEVDGGRTGEGGGQKCTAKTAYTILSME